MSQIVPTAAPTILSGARQTRPALLDGPPAAATPLPIVRPLFPSLDRFAEDFDTALGTGQVTNNGRHVVAFEEQLSDYVGAPTVVCNNGETALLLLLAATGRVDDVICPSFTFAGTPHAVAYAGGTPRFAEIDDSLCLSAAAAERSIGNRTSGIMIVDSYGIPADYAAFDEVAASRDLALFYDSAAAFGARVDGERTGRVGTGQIFSFHATKPFTTMEGGCVTARDPALIDTIKELRNFGQGPDGDCALPGLNGKMLEVCALVGRLQLPLLEQHLCVRRAAADRLRAGLGEIPGLGLPEIRDGVEPTWSLLPVIVDADRFGLTRDELARALEAEQILVRKYFDPPCHRMSAYSGRGHGDLSRTEATAANVIALPLYNDMREEECRSILTAFEKLFEHAESLRGVLRS